MSALQSVRTSAGRGVFLLMFSVAIALAVFTEIASYYSFAHIDVWPSDTGLDVYGSVIQCFRITVAVMAFTAIVWGLYRKPRSYKYNSYVVSCALVLLVTAMSRNVIVVPLNSVYRYYLSVPSVAMYSTVAILLLHLERGQFARHTPNVFVSIYFVLLANAVVTCICCFYIYPTMISHYRG